jgi:hypothetical protein
MYKALFLSDGWENIKELLQIGKIYFRFRQARGIALGSSKFSASALVVLYRNSNVLTRYLDLQ